ELMKGKAPVSGGSQGSRQTVSKLPGSGPFIPAGKTL
ncbi:uncharacterized, partial [Tachysurus ichikawai]